MKIAFYAPMKAPGHRVPSGDRSVARLLWQALAALGHDLVLASALRAWDGGDPARQRRIARRGAAEAARLIEAWRPAPPGLWCTYHLYHKAPDHLGPAVAEALSLPYMVVEPSFAPGRRLGAWACGHARALAAMRRADALLPMTREDAEGLRSAGLAAGRILPLRPFIDGAPFRRQRRGPARARLARRFGLDPERPLAVTVAMMRPGDKLASYRLLAGALGGLLAGGRLQLLIAGDGPCRAEVEALFAAGATFAGRLAPRSLPGLLAGCDLFLWPAVNEAYGMALLAAQAAGLAVVAGRARGVPEVVADGETGLLAPAGDGEAFAAAAAALVADPQRLAAMGRAAAERCRRRHGIDAAAARLARAIALAASGRAGPRCVSP